MEVIEKGVTRSLEKAIAVIQRQHYALTKETCFLYKGEKYNLTNVSPLKANSLHITLRHEMDCIIKDRQNYFNSEQPLIKAFIVACVEQSCTYLPSILQTKENTTSFETVDESIKEKIYSTHAEGCLLVKKYLTLNLLT
jgi:hypothetical protein